MKRRKTKTIVEVHQISVIRLAQTAAPMLCPECATGDAQMVKPEEASVVANIPSRQIYRMVEGGLLHYLEADDDSLVVCLQSLLSVRDQMAAARSTRSSNASRNLIR